MNYFARQPRSFYTFCYLVAISLVFYGLYWSEVFLLQNPREISVQQPQKLHEPKKNLKEADITSVLPMLPEPTPTIEIIKTNQIDMIPLKVISNWNHMTRSSVPRWIQREEWEIPASKFSYGLPEFALELVNRHTGNIPIQHDLISLLAVALHNKLENRQPLKYLEIGVSVGKCLYTQMQFLNHYDIPSEIYALDIESINPSFARLLNKEISYPFATHSSTIDNAMQEGGVSVFQLTQDKTDGFLIYCAGDEFAEQTWTNLAKLNNQYNLILSDACHTGKAVLHEFDNLLKYNMIYKEHFAVVWDDCSGEIENAFHNIANDIARHLENQQSICKVILGVPGWLGEHEGFHNTCILTTLDLKSMMQSDPTFREYPELFRLACQ